MVWVHVKKELLLLRRDRAGLCVLFVMPMLLVLVLSLVQDDLFRANRDTATKALWVNLDRGPLGEKLVTIIRQNGAIELIDSVVDKKLDTGTARQLVHDGKYQFAIITPAEFSSKIQESARYSILSSLNGKKSVSVPSRTPLTLYFDPTVRGTFRTGILSGLRLAIAGLEMEQKGEIFAAILSEQLREKIREQLAPYGAEAIPLTLPQIDGSWTGAPLIEIREKQTRPDQFAKLPTSVQQNVPAWTLFGMFFIVIPLAGTLLRERQEGTLARLMTMPTTNLSLLMGKVLAYLAVCLVQFLLMLLVGKFILPLFGTPEMELGSAPLALFSVALSSSLAACGFGILVGVIARSYDQASVLGALAVVIMAAVGGIMVPVYVMPQLMQDISVISPLNWGLNGFLDIFVRGGNFLSVVPYIAKLLLFFLSCMVFALFFFTRRRHGFA